MIPQLQWYLKHLNSFEFSVFLHKYDLKYLFPTHTLKVGKRNQLNK